MLLLNCPPSYEGYLPWEEKKLLLQATLLVMDCLVEQPLKVGWLLEGGRLGWDYFGVGLLLVLVVLYF